MTGDPTGTDNAGRYLLANSQPAAEERLPALSALFDPVSIRHFEEVGIRTGWHCWEVGAGSPSLPRWLASTVGPTGAVIATDIDLSRLPDDTTFTARRHDVGTDPAPGRDFDLIHARLVLVHVPQRDAALATMVGALRPGGWLIVEDADPALQPLVCIDEHDEAAALANRLKAGFRTLMAARGVDLAFGRTLPRRLRAAGLVDVTADAYFPVAATECAELERATLAQIGEQLIAAGLATAADIASHSAAIDGGRLDFVTSPLISARGRTAPQ